VTKRTLAAASEQVANRHVGKRHAEALVLRAAAAFEQIAPWAHDSPPVATTGSG
jgi:hypothetical protein